MSFTSCDCWSGRTRVEDSRAGRRGQTLLTVLCLLVLFTEPLTLWARAVALLLLPLAAWLEWQGRARIRELVYEPGRVELVMADGRRWQAGADSPALCYHGMVTLCLTRAGRTRWHVLFADQLPAAHWRKLRVLLLWR